MLLLVTLLFLEGARLADSMPGNGRGGVPDNITVTFENATSVCVSWSSTETAEKYDVTYKPTDASYRVVALVAGNLKAVTLHNLSADTQYQVTVTAVRDGRKYRSRPIVFNTQELPTKMPPLNTWVATPIPLGSAAAAAVGGTGGGSDIPEPGASGEPYLQVRGVEVGIVLLVLLVWVGAIALFFNRWGKIRMLLPYQPDYKEQLKVPGTTASAVCTGQQHSSGQSCPQRFELESWAGRSRPRVNSAIFISSALRDSEFVQHQPFRSDLYRRTRSAENIPLSGMHDGLEDGVPILSISVPTPPDNQVDQHL